MADLFLLSQAQMRRIVRYFPLSHGVARVDDRRIVSAICVCDQEWASLARRPG
jgi:putative transposase